MRSSTQTQTTSTTSPTAIRPSVFARAPAPVGRLADAEQQGGEPGGEQGGGTGQLTRPGALTGDSGTKKYGERPSRATTATSGSQKSQW